MSIIDQHVSTTTDQALMGQLTSSNCIGTFGCHTYYPGHGYSPVKTVSVEAVEGGYIISIHGQGAKRTVALDAQGLAEIMKSWASQFECKAK